MATKAEKMEEQRHAREALASMGIKPGARVYTTVTHVSSSGMTRHVKAYVVGRDGTEPRIYSISGLIATLCGLKRDSKSGAIVMGGCGYDVGHETVYHLGRAMFPKGGPVAKSVRRFQEERAGNKLEKDGGYLLKHDTLG